MWARLELIQKVVVSPYRFLIFSLALQGESKLQQRIVGRGNSRTFREVLIQLFLCRIPSFLLEVNIPEREVERMKGGRVRAVFLDLRKQLQRTVKFLQTVQRHSQPVSSRPHLLIPGVSVQELLVFGGRFLVVSGEVFVFRIQVTDLRSVLMFWILFEERSDMFLAALVVLLLMGDRGQQVQRVGG